MTIKSSGTLTLTDIFNEFGGPKPLRLTNYYRGGAYVPNAAVNNRIPTSGFIKLTDFYGASKYVPGYADYGPGAYDFYTPSGAYTIAFTLQAGGGGGAGGSDGGYVHVGPPGEGGYAGGRVDTGITTYPGEHFILYVGAGGAGGIDACCNGLAGAVGGDTYLVRASNGQVVARSYGGAGGRYNGHCNDGSTCTPNPIFAIQQAVEKYNYSTNRWEMSCPSGYTLAVRSQQVSGGDWEDVYMCYLYGSSTGQNSSMGAGGTRGGTNAPGTNGGTGAGGGGGGCVVGSCVGRSRGGDGGNGWARIAW